MNTTIVMLLLLVGAVVHEAIGASGTTSDDVSTTTPTTMTTTSACDIDCQREERIKLIERNLTELAALNQALQSNLTELAALNQALQGNMTTTGTQLTNLQKSVICGNKTQWLFSEGRTIKGYTVTAFGTAKKSDMDDEGEYTVGSTGVYQITVSGDTAVDNGDDIEVGLWYAGAGGKRMIRTYTRFSRIHDSASYTRFLKMKKGEKVSLVTHEENNDHEAKFNNIVFCVALYGAL